MIFLKINLTTFVHQIKRVIMEQIKKEFTNGEVTIVFVPKRCFHSERCIKGLPGVFNVENSPWIDANGAETSMIISQVKKCPSGALTYYLNQELEGEAISASIEVIEDGPYLIKGNIKIEDLNGKASIQKGPFALCRCGQSQNKPYCDSSHRKHLFPQ